jgi:hypothetical protein
VRRRVGQELTPAIALRIGRVDYERGQRATFATRPDPPRPRPRLPRPRCRHPRALRLAARRPPPRQAPQRSSQRTMLPDTDRAAARALAERLRSLIRSANLTSGRELLDASNGVAQSRCASDYKPECLDCSVVPIVDVRDRPDVQPGAGAVYGVRAWFDMTAASAPGPARSTPMPAIATTRAALSERGAGYIESGRAASAGRRIGKRETCRAENREVTAFAASRTIHGASR